MNGRWVMMMMMMVMMMNDKDGFSVKANLMLEAVKAILTQQHPSG